MKREFILRTLPAVAMGAAFTSIGVAQEAQTQDSLQEVVVTASRIVRSGYTAPTPVTILGVEQMEARGTTNVADLINEIPSFRPSQTPQARAINGAFGANIVDLRGLGSVRTLVLINGHRHVPATTLGEIDLNVIPSSLIERTEVVTGGASAAWGSDAVAGVVNLVLKNKLQGMTANISYGQTDKGDDRSYNASVAGGTGFAGGSGHVMAGFEYDDMGGVGDADTARRWSRQMWGMLTLPASRAPGLASRIVSPNVHYSNQVADGGVISGGPLVNTTFLPGGTPTPFTLGSLVAGNQMIGGDNQTLNFAARLNIVNPVKRDSGLLRVDYDISPAVNVFGEFSVGHTDQNSLTAGHISQANLTINVINPYMPAALRTQMQGLGLTTAPFGRFDSEIGRYNQHNFRDTESGVLGAKGDLPHGWSWDAYYQYGANSSVSDIPNMVLNANYLAAINAQPGPGGTIVCGPLTTARGVADPNCVPFNVFGAGAPSAAAIAYVTNLSHTRTYNREQVGAVTLRGEPVDLWAGPVSLAVGTEWRSDSTDVSVDANQQASRNDFGNSHAIRGSYEVKEAFVETVVPLLKDAAFVKEFDLNGAVRRTDYSLAGAVTTWKVGATFEEASGQLRLRGTKSRDIRAPNLQELYGSAATSVLNIRDPNTGLSALTTVLTSGSTALKPETANTLTYGAALTPKFVPNFQMSADYYRIDIKGIISTLGAQNVVDRCAAGAADLCPLVIRTGGVITTVLNNNLNINRFKTSGVDIEAGYSIPMAKMHAPGTLTVRLLGTRVFDLVTIDSVGPVDRVKQTVPAWAWTMNMNYALARFSTNLTWRYIGPTLIDATLIGPDDPRYNPALPNSINRNLQPSITYTDLSAQYTVHEKGNGKIVVYGVVNNLFDRDPPGYGGNNLIGGSLYDLVGRFMRVGVRLNY